MSWAVNLFQIPRNHEIYHHLIIMHWLFSDSFLVHSPSSIKHELFGHVIVCVCPLSLTKVLAYFGIFPFGTFFNSPKVSHLTLMPKIQPTIVLSIHLVHETRIFWIFPMSVCHPYKGGSYFSTNLSFFVWHLLSPWSHKRTTTVTFFGTTAQAKQCNSITLFLEQEGQHRKMLKISMIAKEYD